MRYRQRRLVASVGRDFPWLHSFPRRKRADARKGRVALARPTLESEEAVCSRSQIHSIIQVSCVAETLGMSSTPDIAVGETLGQAGRPPGPPIPHPPASPPASRASTPVRGSGPCSRPGPGPHSRQPPSSTAAKARTPSHLISKRYAGSSKGRAGVASMGNRRGNIRPSSCRAYAGRRSCRVAAPWAASGPHFASRPAAAAGSCCLCRSR
jgi:hypothetical protein